MKRTSVSNIIYQNLFEYSQENKENLVKTFNLCDVTQYELERKGGRIPEYKHIALQEMMVNSDKSDHYIISKLLGGSLSNAYQLFPELIGLCLNRESLEDAIICFVDNACIIGNCDIFTTEKNDSHIKICYVSKGPEGIQKVNSISNIILLSDLIHTYCPEAIQNVSLKVRGLHKKNLFDEKFKHKCLINQSENSIIIKTENLKEQYSSYNHQLSLLQREQVKTIKNSITVSDTFSSSVLEIILNIIHSKKISEQKQVLSMLCDVLNVSRWTLHRRLKSEDTNFKVLYLDAKIKVSIKLLMETNLSIQEISDWLAFSSHSAFTRFFRAKMLVSPTVYRNQFLQ